MFLPVIEKMSDELVFGERSYGPGMLSDRGHNRLFPLRDVRVRAWLTGMVASVTVRQIFTNPYFEAIEAVYVFPLPHGAAVHDFKLTVGSRVLEGELQERGQARATYAEGVAQGHRAALVEQERDNVFTTTIGNLPPGEEVSVELTYAQKLTVRDNETEFFFPLVVAPRYIPGTALERDSVGAGLFDTDRVPDASRVTPPSIHHGARLDIEVALDTGGVTPQRIACSQHSVTREKRGRQLVVKLGGDDALLNRDFVLRYRLAEVSPRAMLMRKGEHFLLSVLPPTQPPRTQVGRDIVFLVDRSGSMQGKMDSCRRAVLDYLDTLTPADRFSILAFDHGITWFGDGSLSGVNMLEPARQFVSSLKPKGGTELQAPLQEALDLLDGGERQGCVVLITDGQVGNESELYRTVQQRKSTARIFTLGIDTAVNDAFLRRLAQLGRGTCELVTPGESLERALGNLARETGHPVLTDLRIIDQGAGVAHHDLVPNPLPDLYAARPVHVLGRLQRHGRLELQGRWAGATGVWCCCLETTETDNPALGVLWARERVAVIEDRLRLETEADRQALEEEMLELALAYKLVTRLTAFVVVDRSARVTDGQAPATVVQPSEPPAQWRGGVRAGLCLSGGDLFGGAAACEAAPAGGDLFGAGLMCEKAPRALMGGKPSLSGGKPSLGLRRGLLRPGLSTDGADKPILLSRRPAPKTEPLPTASDRMEAFLKLLRDYQTGATVDLERSLEELLEWLASLSSLRRTEFHREGVRILADLRAQTGDPLKRLISWTQRLSSALTPRARWWSDAI